MNEITNSNYEGFDYPATDIAKFLLTAGIFTVMLKDGKITHFSPDDTESFLQWLKAHRIPDIRVTG